MSTRVSQLRRQGPGANSTRRDQQLYERDPSRTRKATTISFTAPGTIADSGNGLAVFGVNQNIEVRGSPANTARYVVVTSSAGTLTVLPAGITTAAAGPLVTINSVD